MSDLPDNYFAWILVGISISLGAFLFQLLRDLSEKVLAWLKLCYWNLRFYRFKKHFNRDRDLKSIDRKHLNYMILFHDRKHAIPEFPRRKNNFKDRTSSICTERSDTKVNFYTVGNDPEGQPHILLDLSDEKCLDVFPDDSFDLILLSSCTCHYLDLIFREKEDYFIRKFYSLLKNDGWLVIRREHLSVETRDKFTLIGFTDKGSNYCSEISYTFIKEKIPENYRGKRLELVKRKIEERKKPRAIT